MLCVYFKWISVRILRVSDRLVHTTFYFSWDAAAKWLKINDNDNISDVIVSLRFRKVLSRYEFAYKITHDEGAEQGHQASNEGVKSSGQYYVNLAGGEKQTVNYVADENGFHPHYTFKSSSSESHFKLGDQVKPLNLSHTDKYEINFESQNGKIKNVDNTESYATSPSPTTLSSTESILLNEVNTALPSSIHPDILKLSRPEGTVYTPSFSTSESTESVRYETPSEVSTTSPVTNASPSSSTRNIEDNENSLRHNIQDPNLPQSPLFVSSSERFLTLSTTSEKTPMKVYPSTPGSATTASNVFYVNAQSDYNSTTAMLEGFESYLKEYLNANEVKSNDIDSNFKVISDKSELDKLIKNDGNEYEIIKLSDIMAEKKRRENEKLTVEATTPMYFETQNIYTQIPSTYSTRSMDSTSTVPQGSKDSSEPLGLMKYFEVKNEDKEQYKISRGNFENENLNSFVDKHTDPDSATSELSNLQSSQQFAVNYGDKMTNSNSKSTLHTKEPTYGNEEKLSVTYSEPSSYTAEPTFNTILPYKNTSPSDNAAPSTEIYSGQKRIVEAKIIDNEGKELNSGNQFAYYQSGNTPRSQVQEQIYFKELQGDGAKLDKNSQVFYSNIPVQQLNGGLTPDSLYSQLQNNINQKQLIYNNQFPINNQPDLSAYNVIPFPYNIQPNSEQYGNAALLENVDVRYQTNTNNIVSSTQSSLYDKPIIVAEMNNTRESPKIVSQSNGESGHMVKTIDSLSNIQNTVNTATTINDIEAAKVDQLQLTTPKTVSKKDIDNNKLDDGYVERQNIKEMPSYTTTIEVFKSVPVEQYVIPDIPTPVQKPLVGEIKQYQHIQINQHPYQTQAPIHNTSPYPYQHVTPVPKTRLQPVFSSQPQRQPLFRPDPSYFNNEQKYYTDQLGETKTPYNNQEPIPIPLNYGLKDLPSGHLSYRTPLSHQLQSIQQYGVPQYSVFTNPLSPSSMAVVHPSYSISVNPLPLHQVQQQMVSNSVPYASQFYPHYIPADVNISHPNLINPGPTINSQVKYYQPEKSISAEIYSDSDPYYYPKPIHNPFDYPAKQAYNHKTRLVPVAQHFNIPTTVLHLVRTPYKSTLNKLKTNKYNPNESYYLKEMYNYAPQFSKENYRYEGSLYNPQFPETMHYDGRSKHAPFRPSFPMYDSVYPPMAYYETQYMAPNEQISNNNNYRRPHVRSIRRPNTSGNMKKLNVEYGGFKPPMVPSTEIKDGDVVQASSTEK
ncbi:hypothetical protein M8J76_015861 [Diaphorina citri]|nr:hypothetical protein M8J75_004497 [Diaphorina citri]KAI5737697.1 hypothetical protein M8J76_015861 [Diaphorina citri]KAI5743706.1 hypothetical protein M8J77_021258 [Diaphorina citri]